MSINSNKRTKINIFSEVLKSKIITILSVISKKLINADKKKYDQIQCKLSTKSKQSFI